MEEFLHILTQSLSDDTVIALTLSKPMRPSAETDIDRVTVRPVDLRGQRRWQWTEQRARQQHHENLTAQQVGERAAGFVGSTFRHAHLFTSIADLTLRVDSSGRSHLKKLPPSKSPLETAPHDRQKSYVIPEGEPCAFLHELGIMTAAGKIHRSRRDKFRQINRFLEFVNDIIPYLPEAGRLEVVDFGCGLSYLTFALHHLLSDVHGRNVRILGVDQNPEVIDRCRRTCCRLDLTDLEFASIPITETPVDRDLHLAVALHACDTATDDALATAVRLKATAILAAPCCQHELAPQLKGAKLRLLTEHGILRERLAAMATDALRAALLEKAGYRTQILEFIDTEHTPKNLLIRAVRTDGRGPNPQLANRIDELKALVGVRQMRLEQLLKEVPS